jgi:hypothetical protein
MRGRRPGKNRRRIHWNTLRIFQGRERRRRLRIVRRSRTVYVGQAPSQDAVNTARWQGHTAHVNSELIESSRGMKMSG